ncbi:hypothetical protein CLV56_3867 [Mumia flava]|uniref:Flagellar biosynthetic protein FliP n=1 Tax=Mumia flava TaxID=1348852 RepID=A0A2M9B8X7_9ACTN|nr:hypothetical protein [Mumia flava]PJJ54358.1 hypothetical protein CLV56_3867 [Mumia flava]
MTVVRFVRHFAEMILAMVLGMMLLHPPWRAVADATDAAWMGWAEIDALAMATAMAVPMAAWMWFRGHGRAAIWEMSLAMYAGFVLFFPLLWAGAIGGDAMYALGHVAMVVLMLAVMLRRPHEYAHRHGAEVDRAPEPHPAAGG